MIRLLPFRRKAEESGWRAEAAQVLAALRDRRLGSRRARDRIPAYLVVGPPGMGKSALIARSGLRLDPPLELDSSQWWIGEDALFVEVSGEAGRDGSHPVLPLLRALRPAAPVSGIILVLSPADLTLADMAERVEMSGAITRLMIAFEARFRYAPPLYVAVSKLDLTPGFSEFFDRLEPYEREQPWGFTLPVELARRRPGAHAQGRAASERTVTERAPEPARDRWEDRWEDRGSARASEGQSRDNGAREDFAREDRGREARRPEEEDVVSAYRAGFRHLLASIRARVTQWISPETDPVQCARIFGFGAQVAALEAILKPIVEPLMPADDRRWPGAWLRGVYLSSTQQDALAIDVLLPDMAKRFALPRSGMLPPDLSLDDQALGYFVEGMFRRVILPEAGLALQGHPGLRAAAVKGWALAAASVLACAGLGVASFLSYGAGIARIAGVNAAVGPIESGLTVRDPAALPAVLTAVEALAALKGDEPAVSPIVVPVLSLDRYAEVLIAEGVAPLYDRAVVNSLGPHLDHRLARDLVRRDASAADLRAALAAAQADAADASGAYRRWLAAGGDPLAPEQRPAFVAHGTRALRLGAVPAVGPGYAAFTRGVLESRGETR